MYLYQIGNVPLHLHGDTLNHDYGSTARGRVDDLLWSPYPRWTNNQWLLERHQVQVRGKLIGTARRRADQTLQELRRMVGRPTDVIAYEYQDARQIYMCPCEHVRGAGALVWFHNFGLLRSVDVSEREFTATIEIGPFWDQLNPYLWYFGSMPESAFQTSSVYAASRWPSANELYNDRQPDTRMWVRRNLSSTLFLYEPDNWPGMFDCVQLSGSVAVDQERGWYNHIGDIETWSAPPRTLFAFKNLPSSGFINLTMKREDVWNHADDLITVDFVQLEAEIPFGILPQDILIFGDIQRLPGVIYRNGELIDFTPAVVNYNTFWPGMMHPGTNRWYADIAGPTMSYLVLDRRL